MSTTEIIRLNKFISNSGICNRRQADDYIIKGRVTVNDILVNKLGSKVSVYDKVKLDGNEISKKKLEYIVCNKPKGFLSKSSKINTKTIYSILPTYKFPEFRSIDFLKKEYKGLILISNDMKFINKINLKKKSLNQIFHLKLNKNFLEKDFKLIKNFKDIENLSIRSFNYVDGAEKNELGIELFIETIKDLERLFTKFNYKIISCDRVLFYNITKKDLKRGQWRNLTKQEFINFNNIK